MAQAPSGTSSSPWETSGMSDTVVEEAFESVRSPSPPTARDAGPQSPSSYTIAWICALHFEMAAAMVMLDEAHPSLPSSVKDRNHYALGRIGEHNVVIACLPEGHYGTVNAARVLADLIRTFTCIRAGLMVGVGGGAPSRQNDVRLGDVVVGTRIMPYELGKVLAGGHVQHTAVQKVPDHLLCTLVSKARATEDEGRLRMSMILAERFASRPEFRPPHQPDVLFDAGYPHDESSDAPDCEACDTSRSVPRLTRKSTVPEVHYGGIASGDKLRRDAQSRDQMARALNVLCFEMETAGLMDILPCLPIRGICDYADSHKHKAWQKYAAAVAAAYARMLLETLSVDAGSRRLELETPPSSIDHQRRKFIMKTLGFSTIDSRRDTIKRAHAQTCQWLLDNPTFQEWLGTRNLSRHHGFLWIKGKPGTGKSTLMKFLYQRTKAADRQQLTASFFFHARGTTLEKSVAGMYRSLLLQLLQRYPDLQKVLDSVSGGETRCPTVEVLKDLLEDAIRALGKRSLTCFIDALDEGDEQQVIEMVRYFEALARQAMQRTIRLRICFSSRHYPYINLQYGLRLTLEDQLGHTDDLASYIDSHLRLKCPAPMPNLHAVLLERSRGVFLWIVLVVEMLNKESYGGGFALMKRLNEIPSDLKQLFTDMLLRDQEDMHALRICITWILFSYRPLSPAEFYHAMWSGMAAAGRADGEPPDASSPDFDTSAGLTVISSSKGLAETTVSHQPVVQFIHESVRDFLLKDNGLASIWPDFGEARGHDSLKAYCTYYLRRERVAQETSSLRSSLPFMKYALSHVFEHAEAAAESFPQADFLLSFPLSRWITLRDMLYGNLVFRYRPDTRLLYILANRGLPNLIRTRMKQAIDEDGLGTEYYRRPFFAAIASTSRDAVGAVLLASPSDLGDLDELAETWKLGQPPLMRTQYRDCTPLTWATTLGFIRLAMLLVRQGADVQESDGRHVTPLGAAVLAKHEPLIRLFLSDRETRDRSRSEKELLRNTSHLDDVVARIMKMARSGSLRAENPIFSHLALKEPKVMQALIHSGVEVDACDAKGRTLLRLAIVHGSADTVRVLVEAGADVNNRDKYGEPLLNLAIARDNQAVAELLIKAGAHVDRRGGDDSTPLKLAVCGGSHDMVRVLLDAGADVNGRDADGQTPLDHAMPAQDEALIEMLLQAGAEAAQDQGG